MSFASWYNNQYSTWNRTRSLQQSPYLARTNTNASRTATAMAQNGGATAVVVNMAGDPPASNAAKDKDKKTPDSLFGPNIGVVSSGPAWTAVNEKKVLADELTHEVVKGWIEKSKEASQPTTTLQALVNLKRPTLRLSPLSPAEDPTSPSPQPETQSHHGLEFEYDCDAAKCGIYVHVLLPAGHPDAPTPASANGLAKLLVFETVVEGGFGRMLKLEEGAMLDLGRFEQTPKTAVAAAASSSNPTANANSITPIPEGGSVTPEPGSVPAAAAETGTSADTTNSRQSRRRFTHFHFRKRTQNRSVSGPALAVVDAEPSPSPAEDGKGKKDDADNEGVRVTIRLAALDEQGTELVSPNEQVTYLHVVRFGAKPAAEPGTEEGAENDEDTRPWVVKVVKREATIGPHTFHLHEIYGLTSSSSANHAPTAPLPEPHTYPPASPTTAAPQTEDEPSSECLVCLSSPREVVLLPCRHLVACKDCALNMVEFGAGGNITQAEEPTAGPGADDNNAEGDAAGPAAADGTDAAGTATADGPAATATQAAAAPAPVTPTANPRRKRKAKGWFCPVCRQPYTSLLRITTAPPPLSGKEREANGDDAASPVPGATSATGESTADDTGRGLFSRPNFLRGLSRNNNPQGDLESQTALGAARVSA